MVEGCPYPIEALLPHARPMILLDRVVSYGPDFVEAALTIRPDAPFFETEKGGIASHIALEWMAQCCAAFVGLEALLAASTPQIGFLLGTRNFTADCAWLRAGESFRIRADLVFRDGETGIFNCAVYRDEHEIIRGQLTLFQPNDIQAVLADQGISIGR
jgi:predicted hotdog family 3-hydroxylacyl-ACP dehydratase